MEKLTNRKYLKLITFQVSTCSLLKCYTLKVKIKNAYQIGYRYPKFMLHPNLTMQFIIIKVISVWVERK